MNESKSKERENEISAFECLKKHRRKIIFYCILFLVVIPIFIHIVFIVGKPKTRINEEAFFNYYSSLVTLFGTMVLGVVTLYQNHVICKMEEKRRAEEIEIEYNSKRPIFRFGVGLSNDLLITIENVTMNNVYSFEIKDMTVKNIKTDDEESASKIINNDLNGITISENRNITFNAIFTKTNEIYNMIKNSKGEIVIYYMLYYCDIYGFHVYEKYEDKVIENKHYCKRIERTTK